MSSAPVNRPTNVQERDSEINKKLQLYGIATGKLQGESNWRKADEIGIQPLRMERSHPYVLQLSYVSELKEY